MILKMMTKLKFISSQRQRSEDGDTFIVKDAEMLEREIIPSYFDHSKFSSFSRQLNFYGFRKVPQLAKDKNKNKKSSVRPVKFFHEFFKRGREELLCQIQRSTNRGNNKSGLTMNSTAMAEQDREINGLKNTVMTLEEKLASMKRQFESMENQMTLVLSMGLYGAGPSGQQQNGMNYQYVANNSNLIPNNHIHGSKSSTSTSYSDSTYGTDFSSSYQNKAGSAFCNTQTPYPLKSHIYQASAPNSDAFKLEKDIISTPKRNSGAGKFDDTFDEQDSSRASTISPSSSTVGATLEPHPNVKEITDPIDLLPCPDFERGVSFLRGFSKDFEPIGL